MSTAATFLDLNQGVSLSAGHDRMIVFARRASGGLAHIDEVDNGKACGCRCLACNGFGAGRHGRRRRTSAAMAYGGATERRTESGLAASSMQLRTATPTTASVHRAASPRERSRSPMSDL